MSDFHSITPYGSKVCHGSVTGVTGPDKSLEIDLTYNPASLQSTAGPSQLIPLDVIQERESASAFSAWTPEMIKLVIQKLDNLTIMGWQLKIEYDNHIDTLYVELREHDLLINQLNDHTMMLMQEIADSSAGILQFYNEFLLHLSNSTEYIC